MFKPIIPHKLFDNLKEHALQQHTVPNSSPPFVKSRAIQLSVPQITPWQIYSTMSSNCFHALKIGRSDNSEKGRGKRTTRLTFLRSLGTWYVLSARCQAHSHMSHLKPPKLNVASPIECSNSCCKATFSRYSISNEPNCSSMLIGYTRSD